MKASSLVFLLVLGAVATAACKDVPIDDQRNDRRLFPAGGVIRGTVTYVGPRPCSRGGHIVGNAIVLVFDRRNPPPPQGLATTATNFVAVPGDALFANEPRSVGSELFCPPEEPLVEVSAPFTIAPVEGGSYVALAFYDRRGRFWPTFKFRNLPEAGDLGGGYVDVEDARKNAQNPGYEPRYLPIDVGAAQPGAPAGAVPDFVLGPTGYVADNVPVTIGSVVPFTRPYFHPKKVDASGVDQDSPEKIGEPLRSPANDTGDPFAVPILAVAQDVHILAPPTTPTPETLTAYQRGFPALKLAWGVASGELDAATDPGQPYGLQLPALPPSGKGGLVVFGRGVSIPENPQVPDLWPQVALVKLANDPRRQADPQSLVVQGTPQESVITGKPPGPLVVLTGITLDGDSLARTIAGPIASAPSIGALRDHVSVLLRPAALCFDPRHVDQGGLLVTPHFTGRSADASETGDKLLFDPKTLENQPRVREVRRGCLPQGRYAISLVYPTGQAWTVPNEIGGCAAAEGGIVLGDGTTATCATKPRNVLLSQGSRAVVEIIGPKDPALCDDNPVPPECSSP
jgi:hypothetical protein